MGVCGRKRGRRVALVVLAAGLVAAATPWAAPAGAAKKPRPVDACTLLTAADIQATFGIAVTQTGADDGAGLSSCEFEIADNAKEDAFFTVTARWPATAKEISGAAKGYAAFKKRATTTVGKHPALYLDSVSTLTVHTGDQVVSVLAQRLCPSPACPGQRSGYLDVAAPLKQAATTAVGRLP